MVAMGERLSIREATRLIVTWDGKPVSTETVYFWIRKKDLRGQRNADDAHGTYFIDTDDLRRFIANYSTYRLRDSDAFLPTLEEMLRYAKELKHRMELVQREHAELVAEEEALQREIYGNGVVSRSDDRQRAPRQKPADSPTSRGRNVVRATLSAEFRSFWVGRGDVGDLFAYFLYLHEAHGINHNTANSHRRFARKAVEAGTPNLYPCTLMPAGLYGGDDRILVTREQAITNIQVIHHKVLVDSDSDILPPEFLCLDNNCPWCPAIWPSYGEAVR